MTTHAPSSPATPFAIGLKPLVSDNFLIVDNELPRYLAEKRHHYEKRLESVFMAQEDTISDQRWAADKVISCIRKHHRDKYDVCDKGKVSSLDRRLLLDMAEWDHAPIAGVALAIQDDLVLMRNREGAWHLDAASLCFPSSWNLSEKFGRPMRSIHAPVPLTELMAKRIDRMFDMLKPETPVWRANWSLDGDGNLRHDRLEMHREQRNNRLSGTIWFRSEYQTLHKSPDGGTVLFTIRIASSTLQDVLETRGGPAKIAKLARQYHDMSDDQLAYKGIAFGAKRLIKWMEKHGVDDIG